MQFNQVLIFKIDLSQIYYSRLLFFYVRRVVPR
jgi:hypothetical protein